MTEEDTSCDYLDRLEKEYEKAKEKKELKNVFKLKNVKEITDWRCFRQYLTQDFVDNSIDIAIIAEHVPCVSQENRLISDLLACFIGGNGYYIQAESLSNKNAVRTFKIDKDVDVKLKYLTERCLDLAVYYSQVTRFIEANKLLKAGRVNQALSHAFDIAFVEYKTYITELESIHHKENIGLQQLWFQIQDVLRTLGLLYHISLDISTKDLRGATTLGYLHEKRQIESDSKTNLLKFLIKSAAEPYMQSIKEWIYDGIIFDPFDEFMVVENQKTSFKDSHSIKYWEKRYQIRKGNVPSFLEPVSSEILKSGLFLNVIKENITSYDKSLTLVNIEELKYSSKPSKYFNVIRKAYIHASSNLLKFMMDNYQLINRFNFMKKYFLFQQGDFIIQVFDMCKEELPKQIFDIIPSRLETLVEMAIRGDSCSLKNELTVLLQPQDLWYQVSRILSVTSTQDQDQKHVGTNPKLRVFESFTLSMNCQWPISLIFNERTMSCYQMLFRLLFYCKFIEKILFKAWIIDQSLRKFPLEQMKKYSIIFSLRQKMIYFIQNMQYYMVEEAIEPNWIEFQQQLKALISENSIKKVESQSYKNVYSLDDLLIMHKHFLDKCINDCLLSNATLFPIFMQLLSICKEFVIHIIKNEESVSNLSVSNESTFFDYLLEIEEKFQEQYRHFLSSIAESDFGATKILEILNRANFNFYFDSLLQKP